MVIERLDLVNPPKSLDDYVNKLVEAKFKKAKATVKKNQQKNCWADVKNQTSTPTENGQNSRRASSDRSPSSTSTPKGKKSKSKKKTAQPKTTSYKQNQRRGRSNPSEKPPLTANRAKGVEAQAPESTKDPSGVRETPHGHRRSQNQRLPPGPPRAVRVRSRPPTAPLAER